MVQRGDILKKCRDLPTDGITRGSDKVDDPSGIALVDDAEVDFKFLLCVAVEDTVAVFDRMFNRAGTYFASDKRKVVV